MGKDLKKINGLDGLVTTLRDDLAKTLSYVSVCIQACDCANKPTCLYDLEVVLNDIKKLLSTLSEIADRIYDVVENKIFESPNDFSN